ncbi:MAG: hypothetical protein EAZ27_00925 [Cytophagales bacterium]|nr:MAG: hypothetical protein EAZ27_00925 [Cytophagales bacterium]
MKNYIQQTLKVFTLFSLGVLFLQCSDSKKTDQQTLPNVNCVVVNSSFCKPTKVWTSDSTNYKKLYFQGDDLTKIDIYKSNTITETYNFDYNSNHHPIKITIPKQNAEFLSEFEYTNGLVSKIIYKTVLRGVVNFNLIYTYKYDSQKNMTSAVFSNYTGIFVDSVSFEQYNACGRPELSKKFRYDRRKKIYEITDSTVYKYDQNNNRISTIRFRVESFIPGTYSSETEIVTFSDIPFKSFFSTSDADLVYFYDDNNWFENVKIFPSRNQDNHKKTSVTTSYSDNNPTWSVSVLYTKTGNCITKTEEKDADGVVYYTGHHIY